VTTGYTGGGVILLTFSCVAEYIACSLTDGDVDVNDNSLPQSTGDRRFGGLALRGIACLLLVYLISLGPVSVYAFKHKSFNLIGYLYPLLWLKTTPLQPIADAYISFWDFLLGSYV